jgi:SAM-dependent methyltransferase
MKYISPLTKSSNVQVLFEQEELPIFQNKIYPTREEAINVVKRRITLAQCKDSGFVFSAGFDMSILDYDEKYQNEQANSRFFQSHLESIIDLLKSKNLLTGKVLEIGCGKGYFMDMLLQQGIDIIGIDPTYEGNSEIIIKDYYSKKYSYLNADLIILRHTLEHIPEPHDFLKMIAEANNYKGYIYVEIPTFDWIVNHNAVEDVFYEHCNYFTPMSFATQFRNCEINYVFNKQYLGIVADLSTIRNEIEAQTTIENHQPKFNDKLVFFKEIVNNTNNIAIWGAGAKGSTFLNLTDPKATKVKCVVDINPKKQHKYIGGTGHPIISPEQIVNYEIDNIIIMNTNYIDEIKSITNKKLITI